MIKLIKDQCFQKLGMVIANYILQDLVGSMSISIVVSAYDDEVGIITKGYKTLYQLLGDCLQQKGIPSNIFISPKRLNIAKGDCNCDVIDKLGKYHHFNDTIFIARWEKTKSTLGQYSFEDNKFNNIFVNLCR